MREYFELQGGAAGGWSPAAAVGACVESENRRLLMDDGALPRAFQDLSTGVAGGLVQRLTTYGLRMAAVVPDPSVHSRPFRDFAREANAGPRFRFFRTARRPSPGSRRIDRPAQALRRPRDELSPPPAQFAGEGPGGRGSAQRAP